MPKLIPTNILSEYQPLINGGGGRTERPNYKGKTFAVDSKKRSRFFCGVASAMAAQWGAERMLLQDIQEGETIPMEMLEVEQ